LSKKSYIAAKSIEESGPLCCILGTRAAKTLSNSAQGVEIPEENLQFVKKGFVLLIDVFLSIDDYTLYVLYYFVMFYASLSIFFYVFLFHYVTVCA